MSTGSPVSIAAGIIPIVPRLIGPLVTEVSRRTGIVMATYLALVGIAPVVIWITLMAVAPLVSVASWSATATAVTAASGVAVPVIT